ncbi:MAG: ABC transporter ATP-binding protein [Granulosicoccus sp.]
MPQPFFEPDLLDIDNLSVSLGKNTVLDRVCLSINPGEMVGLVGESGCGKSVTALSVLGLLPHPPMSVRGGKIVFQNNNLLHLSEHQIRAIRGNSIAMIFQEPMTSLNPVFTVVDQLTEGQHLHGYLTRKNRRRQGRSTAAALLDRVGLGSPEKLLDRYPHELSGGQRQRVMIAMALACDPALLIADEPTTALDVTVQAQILELLEVLCREQNLAVLLITHDLALVQNHCDRVCVMYCGQIVEQGPSKMVFAQARHRYTQALLTTVPAANTPGSRLPAIEGSVPQPEDYPATCRFAPRCTHRVSRCTEDAPQLDVHEHAVRCWNPAL